MGKIHKHLGEFKALRRLISSQFFNLFFFFKANMNLTVFAGILLAVTTVTARRARLGEKTIQAAAKADEPDKTKRKAARPASLVEKINQAAAEADEPDIRTTKQPLRIVFLCDWAVHCDNPDHTERRKKGCCRGYTGCGADGMGACP